MKPKPFASLNHFTVPWMRAIVLTFHEESFVGGAVSLTDRPLYRTRANPRSGACAEKFTRTGACCQVAAGSGLGAPPGEGGLGPLSAPVPDPRYPVERLHEFRRRGEALLRVVPEGALDHIHQLRADIGTA